MLTPRDQERVRNEMIGIAREAGNPFLLTLVGQNEVCRGIRERYINEYPRLVSLLEAVDRISLVASAQFLDEGDPQCMVQVDDLPLTYPDRQLITWNRALESHQARVMQATTAPSTITVRRILNEQERESLIRFIRDHVQKNGGKMLSAAIGEVCLNDPIIGVLRERFSSLRQMLAELSPEIYEEFDESMSAAVVKTAINQTVEEIKEQIARYPNVESAVEDVFKFAFIGYINKVVKTLKPMTGIRSNDFEMWKAFLAIHWKEAVETGSIIYHHSTIQGFDMDYCLFDTGLRSLDDLVIYIGLKEGDVPGEVPWTLVEYFTLADQESVMAKMMREELGITISKRNLSPQQKITLAYKANNLTRRSQLLQQPLRTLSEGRMVDEESVKAIISFVNEIKKLYNSGLLEYLDIDFTEGPTFEQLANSVGTGRIILALEQLQTDFDAIVNRVHEFFRAVLSVNTDDETNIIRQSRDLMQKVSDGVRNGRNIEIELASLQSRIGSIRNLVDILYAGQFDRVEKTATDFQQASQLLIILGNEYSKHEDAADALAEMDKVEKSLALFVGRWENHEDEFEDIEEIDSIPEPKGLGQAVDDVLGDDVEENGTAQIARSSDPKEESIFSESNVVFDIDNLISRAVGDDDFSEIDVDLTFDDDRDSLGDDGSEDGGEPESDTGHDEKEDTDITEAAVREKPSDQPNGAREKKAGNWVPCVLSRQLMAEAAEGEADPELTTLQLGELQISDTQDAEAKYLDAAEAARIMLVKPEARTLSTMRYILEDAVCMDSPVSLGQLNRMMPPCLEKDLFSFIERNMLLTDQDETLRGGEMYNLCKAIDGICTDLEGSSLEKSVKKYVSTIVFAHVPRMLLSYFQKGIAAQLLSSLKNLNAVSSISANLDKLLNELDLIIQSNEDIYFCRDQIDISSYIRSLYISRDRVNAIQRLKTKAENLMNNIFRGSTINYANARRTMIAMPDRSERVNRMLNSLLEGEILEPTVRPFVDDREMMNCAHQVQSEIIEVCSNIVGPPQKKILEAMRELNTAYQELLDLQESDCKANVSEKWHTKILDWIDRYLIEMASQKGSIQSVSMRKYYEALCNRKLYTWESISAKYETFELIYNEDQTWPLFSEDAFICVLLVKSGALREMKTWRENADIGISAETFRHLLDDLIKRIEAVDLKLWQLKEANMIDSEELASLTRVASLDMGWLQQIAHCVEQGESPEDMLPLLRFEIEIWYIESRLNEITNSIADKVINAIRPSLSHEEGDRIALEIRDSVSRGEMQGLMDRFSDVVTELTMLKPSSDIAWIYTQRSVQEALKNAFFVDALRDGRITSIPLVQSQLAAIKVAGGANPPTYADIKMVGSALAALNKIGASSDAAKQPIPERKKIIELFFRFMGFANAVVARNEKEFTLTFDAQDRSVSPMASVGRSIAFMNDGRLSIRYNLQCVSDANEVASLLSSVHNANCMPTILICTKPLSYAQKKDLLTQARKNQNGYAFFLMDYCFIRFALYLRESDRIRAFHTCCMMLMRLYPYNVNTVTNMGDGLFYGREGEISKIMNQSVTVIYGGRRLGKTSIMREAQWRWLNMEHDHIAVYVNLKNETIMPERDLWYIIARSLNSVIPELSSYRQQEARVREQIDQEASAIINEIIAFLSQKVERKLLLLLDECDELLYRSVVRMRQRMGESNRIAEMNRLINRSGNKVKIVIAGLDRVTRFARSINAYSMPMDPNSEIYQRFSESIQLRPMLGNDMQNAYDLIDVPFRILGYHLSQKSIIYILRVTCFRPNLIQNYCSHLLTTIRQRKDLSPGDERLYIEVPYECVTGIYERQSTNTQFLADQKEQSITIPLNTDVTSAYAPVAYAVALMSVQNTSRGMFIGFSPSEVVQEILNSNPGFANDIASVLEYITTILSDLVVMGVLRSIQLENNTRYALFSNYMLKMLGDETTIRESLQRSIQLYMDKNNTVAEDLRSMVADRCFDEETFFPLTTGQLESICVSLRENGWAVVVGSKGLLLHDIPRMLQKIRFMGTRHTIRILNPDELQNLLDIDYSVLDDEEVHPIIVVRSGWTKEQLDLVGILHKENPDIMLVALASPDMILEHMEELINLPENHVYYLSRLEHSFRNSWFEYILTKIDHGLEDRADQLRALINKIGEATDDWPAFAKELEQKLKEANDANRICGLIENFRKSLLEQPARLIDFMGLSKLDRHILELVFTFNSVSECLAYGEMEGIDTAEIIRTIENLLCLGVLDAGKKPGDLTNTENITEETIIYRFSRLAVDALKEGGARE